MLDFYREGGRTLGGKVIPSNVMGRGTERQTILRKGSIYTCTSCGEDGCDFKLRAREVEAGGAWTTEESGTHRTPSSLQVPPLTASAADSSSAAGPSRASAAGPSSNDPDFPVPNTAPRRGISAKYLLEVDKLLQLGLQPKEVYKKIWKGWKGDANDVKDMDGRPTAQQIRCRKQTLNERTNLTPMSTVADLCRQWQACAVVCAQRH
jgi:hypothetical protein